MKKLINIPLYVALSVVLFISCKKEESPETAVPLGTITGRIVAANHITPIKVATVFINNNGKLYIAQTNGNGTFSLQAPAGNRHLTIQTGDGSMFRTEMDVVVKEGQITEISSQAVSLTQVATLAYIKGVYDEIEQILVDSMGYVATEITYAQASVLSNITPYDAIFINCGGSPATNISNAVDSSLAVYVANGGSLYVSDWAVASLIGRAGSSSDACSVQRVGGFIADSLLCVRRTGSASTVLNPPITSLSLQTYMNKTSMDEIVYDLGAWEKINTLDANFWETMVTSPAGNPLLIRTNEYTNPLRGTVTIGAAANNSYKLVCVSGPGGQRITLSVKNSEVPALIAAGATSGMCDNLDGSGRIYFTTFHNEPNGHIGTDMRNILDYVILNL